MIDHLATVEDATFEIRATGGSLQNFHQATYRDVCLLGWQKSLTRWCLEEQGQLNMEVV